PGGGQRVCRQALHGGRTRREAEQDLREVERLRNGETTMTTQANAATQGGGAEAEDLIAKIAQLTRMLRDSMRELGLDHAIKEAAEARPDARDRLGYVARMTEQAANRVLNAAEAVQPVQESMQRRARELDERWQAW